MFHLTPRTPRVASPQFVEPFVATDHMCLQAVLLGVRSLLKKNIHSGGGVVLVLLFDSSPFVFVCSVFIYSIPNWFVIIFSGCVGVGMGLPTPTQKHAFPQKKKSEWEQQHADRAKRQPWQCFLPPAPTFSARILTHTQNMVDTRRAAQHCTALAIAFAEGTGAQASGK